MRGMDFLRMRLLPIALGAAAATFASGAHAVVDSIELDAMFAGAGTVLKSDVSADSFGRDVAVIGDINADGLADMLVGAPAGDGGGIQETAYVLFGTDGGFAPDVEVGNFNGSNGFTIITSSAAGDLLGRSATGIGDINADGIDDFAVSAPRADADLNGPVLHYAGNVFVVFGHSGAFAAALDLDALDGSNGFRIEGAQADTRIGYSLDAAGDFNGDGYNDLLIGSHGTSSVDDAWIVLGSASGFPADVSLADVPASGAGFRLVGAAGTESGVEVAGIGDINSDGTDDVIVGAPATTVGAVGNAGRSFVVFGRATAPGGNVLLLDAPATPGVLRFDGVGPGDFSGSALAGIGDINGDGTGDFIIGTPGHNAYVGGAYVVFGSTSLSSMSLAAVVSSGHGFRLGLDGGYNTNAGAAVSGAGDVNDDGIDDFMVAIPGGLPSAEVNREVAVVFGHDGVTPWPSAVDLANLAEGMRLEHTSQVDVSSIGDLRGYVALAGGGDIDGDASTDMLVGSPQAMDGDVPGTWLGRGYLVYGRSGPPPDLIFSDGFEASP